MTKLMTVSTRSAPGPYQQPIKWVLGALPPGGGEGEAGWV